MQTFVTHGISPVQHSSQQDSIEQPGAEYTPLAYATCPKFDSIVLHIDFGEGQIEVLTIWTDERQKWEESGKSKAKKTPPKRNIRKKHAGARKVGNIVQHCVFPTFCGSRRSKSRLGKVVGAEPTGEMRGEKLHAVVV